MVQYYKYPQMKSLPSQRDLLQPTIEAIKQLGGSATIEEIYEKIVENLKLNDVLSKVIKGKTGQSTLKYNLAWVRTILKNQGILQKGGKKIWVLTNNKASATQVVKKTKITKAEEKDVDEEVEAEERWKVKLIKIITEKLSPSSFERLIQRVLREKGFSQVEITGKSGDGGIDGKGIAKINGILSFHIIFQCKRYKGKVSAGAI